MVYTVLKVNLQSIESFECLVSQDENCSVIHLDLTTDTYYCFNLNKNAKTAKKNEKKTPCNDSHGY